MASVTLSRPSNPTPNTAVARSSWSCPTAAVTATLLRMCPASTISTPGPRTRFSRCSPDPACRAPRWWTGAPTKPRWPAPSAGLWVSRPNSPTNESSRRPSRERGNPAASTASLRPRALSRPRRTSPCAGGPDRGCAPRSRPVRRERAIAKRPGSPPGRTPARNRGPVPGAPRSRRAGKIFLGNGVLPERAGRPGDRRLDVSTDATLRVEALVAGECVLGKAGPVRGIRRRRRSNRGAHSLAELVPGPGFSPEQARPARLATCGGVASAAGCLPLAQRPPGCAGDVQHLGTHPSVLRADALRLVRRLEQLIQQGLRTVLGRPGAELAGNPPLHHRHALRSHGPGAAGGHRRLARVLPVPAGLDPGPPPLARLLRPGHDLRALLPAPDRSRHHRDVPSQHPAGIRRPHPVANHAGLEPLLFLVRPFCLSRFRGVAPGVSAHLRDRAVEGGSGRGDRPGGPRRK